MVNKKRICVKCGGEVFGEKCFKESCLEKWKKHWEQRVQEKLPDYQREVELLNRYEVNCLNFEDYSKLKKIRQETNKWKEELENSLFKPQVEQFIKNVEDLENKFPEKIKLKFKDKSKDYCFHKNIHWLGFFQDEETEEPYCLDCGEDENPKFTKAFQKWYCEKVEEWLKLNNLKYYRFTARFLKKNNFYNKWQSLIGGQEFRNIKEEFFIFQEMNKLMEEYLLEFSDEEQGNKKDDKNQESRIKNQESRIKSPI